MMRRVVVTGLGMISSIGHNVDACWRRALAGQTGVARIRAFPCESLPVQIAAEVVDFNPEAFLATKDMKRGSRFIQLALAASKEAIEDSGLDTSTSDLVGTSIGVGIGAIADIDSTALDMHAGGYKKVSPFFIPYVIPNMAAGVTANTFGLRGPNICTTTACTSGTHAVGEAWMYIRSGMADAMVCGGSEAAIAPITVAGFANMKALSRQNAQPELASRPFDRDRDGFVLGEGAGILVLEEYEHAKARGAKIYAELAGYGMSGDAHHLTAPAPEGEGAQRCMRQALRSAGCNPEQVAYINAHGTSTEYNDVYESQAIMRVFGQHSDKLWISSTKGVTGHCLGAAGGIEAVFLAKAIETQVVPPTANLRNEDPACPLDYVPLTAREGKVPVGISNSFGFGGTNATLVMKRV